MWKYSPVTLFTSAEADRLTTTWQPLTHFLKQALGWSPVEISASLAVLDVPWVIKPLYGLVSDFLPIAGYRRRPYLLLAAGAVVLCGIGVLSAVKATRQKDPPS